MKKLLTLLLAVAMLCMIGMLSSCQEAGGTSSDNASAVSPEPSAPPTATEQLETALASYGNYMEAVASSFGSGLTALSGNGTTEQVISLDTLSINGSSMLNDEPLKLQSKTILQDSLAKCDLQLLCAGDTIPAILYMSEDKNYLDLPGLLEKPLQISTGETGSTGTALILTDAQILDAVQKLIESLESAFQDIYDLEKELTITETEQGNVFSMKLTEEQLNAITEKLIELLQENELAEQLGLSDLFDQSDITFPGISGDESDESKNDGENYMTVDLTVENDLPTSLRMVVYEDGALSGEFALTTTASGNDTIIGMSLIVDKETILSFDCTLTTTEGAMTIDAELSVESSIITINLDVVKESEEKITYNGTISIRVDLGGLAVTIPFTVAGSTVSNGKTYETGCVLSASLSGMMDISVSYSSVFTPGETEEIVLPTDCIDSEDLDPETLQEKLQELYPDAAQFLSSIFSLFGGSIGDVDYGTTYTLEDEDIMATIYDDGTITIIAGLDYQMKNNTLLLSYMGKEICSLPYSYNEQTENYVFFGENFSALPEEEAFLYGCELALSYFDENDGTEVEFDFIDDSSLYVYAYLYLTESGDVLRVLLPDGSTLPLDLSFNEDGSILSIGGLDLPIFEMTTDF